LKFFFDKSIVENENPITPMRAKRKSLYVFILKGFDEK
jgi:hypothetical protein